MYIHACVFCGVYIYHVHCVTTTQQVYTLYVTWNIYIFLSYLLHCIYYIYTVQSYLLNSSDGHAIFKTSQLSLFSQFVVHLPRAEYDPLDPITLGGSGVGDESLEVSVFLHVRELGLGVRMSEEALRSHYYQLVCVWGGGGGGVFVCGRGHV